MNIDKTPLVTSLIRACKSDETEELKLVIDSIKQHGISKNDLNSVDKNGRTALSYVCITSKTGLLDFLLRLPGIDVNKADNEGNTPLHFAAEAGQSDIINMLITRSRSLVVDAKNVFGMTPLMKAAIQGRTDCAKRLMFANASTFEKDSGRSYTARQWAYLCGRKFCGDALGELIKNRKVLQAAYPKRDLNVKDKIIGQRTDGGLASKIRNIIPFYRSKLVSEKVLPDMEETLPEVVHSMISESVPTVEVTPANNHQLINKYKSLYGSEKSVASLVDEQQAIPKVPLRRSSYND